MQTTIWLLYVLDKSEEEINLPDTQQTDDIILNLSDLKQQDTTLAKALFAQRARQTQLWKKRKIISILRVKLKLKRTCVMAVLLTH